jgi:tetratricopeptide (TPR) repeat protein
MIEQNSENNIQPKRLNKISLAILVILILILTSLVFSYIRQQKAVKVAGQIATAQDLINHGKFSDAIIVLNNVIANDSENFDAYSLRSIAYGNSRSNDYSRQQGYYVNSLHDVDKLIELQPYNGNHYVNRDLILRALAELPPDSASKFAIYELANDNAEKAMELGVSPDYSYVYRHHARNLIESNHCKDGLEETQNIINHSQQDDPNMDYYNMYLTEAYICLNDLDKALETALRISCDSPVAECRTMFLTEIYFQSGESEKALELLNHMISLQPTYGGWRYFIRALIYYERGEKDLALQDLATGDNYTWYGNGVYWYVKAKMAFDDGDDQSGMLYLQYAESTLDVQYTPLQQKILKELTAKGGSPLIMTPQIPLATTPIP